MSSAKTRWWQFWRRREDVTDIELEIQEELKLHGLSAALSESELEKIQAEVRSGDVDTIGVDLARRSRARRI